MAWVSGCVCCSSEDRDNSLGAEVASKGVEVEPGTGCDAVVPEPAPVDLECKLNIGAEGFHGVEVVGVQGMDFQELSGWIEVSDVEWDVGVFHPEGLSGWLIEDEKHAMVSGHGFAVHESAHPGGGIYGQFGFDACISEGEANLFWSVAVGCSMLRGSACGDRRNQDDR